MGEHDTLETDIEFAGEIAQLAGVAESLRLTPEAQRGYWFRQRGRADLVRRLAAPAPRQWPVRRLVSLGIATCLFGALAMPTLAGPGGVVQNVSAALGFGPPAARATATPVATATLVATAGTAATSVATAAASATPGPTKTATATDADVAQGTRQPNHGATVSAIAKMTPAPGQNHGEQVREVAKDNSGRQDDEEDTATTTAPTPAPAVKDKDGGPKDGGSGKGKGQSGGR